MWRIRAFETFKRLFRNVRRPLTITTYNLLVCPEPLESWNPGILGLYISRQSRNFTRLLGPDAVRGWPTSCNRLSKEHLLLSV